MSIRVLFVDDQPNVLAGLRRMLRGVRNEWEMYFAESVDEALAIMEGVAFDVVVTDMRMPGRGGAELLTEVMEKYPSTARIILSGQADQASVMHSVSLAHQYLTKPCDAETLKRTVSRVCGLRKTLRQDALVRLVSRSVSLPSLPHIYTELLRELQSEDASIQQVASLIEQDVAMTAKLMQMVNSSFFGMPRRINNPRQAAALLGINILKPLVLSAGVFSQFQSAKLRGFSVTGLMEHSVAVSRLAEEIARDFSDDAELAEDALLAGLLHDIGKLLLAANLPEQYSDTLATAREQAIPLYLVEREHFGATHAEIGAYLLGLWGLADPIIEAVAYHNEPSDSLAEGFTALTAVHAADVLINEVEPAASIRGFDTDYLARSGAADRVPCWREAMDGIMAEKV